MRVPFFVWSAAFAVAQTNPALVESNSVEPELLYHCLHRWLLEEEGAYRMLEEHSTTSQTLITDQLSAELGVVLRVFPALFCRFAGTSSDEKVLAKPSAPCSAPWAKEKSSRSKLLLQLSPDFNPGACLPGVVAGA